MVEDTATAIFDCIADDASELTFGRGDIIENIKPAADQGWFYGTLQKNKKTGLFPGNYVTFNKNQPKKYSAAEARANLMQKSSSLAQKTRTAAAPVGTVGTAGIGIETENLVKPASSINSAPVFQGPGKSQESQMVVTQLTRSFSDTALKSNESLLGVDTLTAPRVGKRPPLLVSNQAYAGISDNSDEKGDFNPPKVPPPRPFKPIGLRGSSSPVAAVPPNIRDEPVQGNKKSQMNRDSTVSTVDDGTPFRPSNSKNLNFNNLTPSSLSRYKIDFQKNDNDKDGFLQGDQVKGLDPRNLGLIWSLCDPGNVGKLDVKSFVSGMFLIDEILRGVPVPSKLPDGLLDKCG